MIDPYFSNCCDKSNQKLKRRIPIDKRFTEIKPDILILTHNHLDHTDPETIPYFVKIVLRTQGGTYHGDYVQSSFKR